MKNLIALLLLATQLAHATSTFDDVVVENSCIVPTVTQGDGSQNAASTAYVDTGLALKYDASNPASYVDAAGASAAAPVQSVAGKTGTVTLVKGDVGLGNVDNTSDANKPVSTATQTALDGKEPTITGTTSADYWGGDKVFHNFVAAVASALGFTPENVANKSTDGTFASNSDTLYPSQKAAKTYVDTSHPQIYYHYPVVAGVAENDIVMNATDVNTLVAPLSFKKATNGDLNYYMQIYGVAKNVSGGFADIWLGTGTVVAGFSFGAFVGVDYYLDPATPGGLTFNGPATGTTPNPIKVGRALDATHLILYPIAQFVQVKGDLYSSDGSYDVTCPHGTNGQVPVYDSTTTCGIAPKAAIVATTPFTFTSSTRTLTIATATNSVAGVLSAADHTTFAAAAPLASPAFTGTPSMPTGTTGVTQAANDSSTKLATTAFVTTADNLKANLASPTFSGTPSLPTGTTGVTQSAGNSTTALATTAFVTTADNLKANIASATFTGDVNSSTGNVLISTIGKGLQVKQGTNAKIGQATLVGGTKTVSNTSVTTNSRIFLSVSATGGTPSTLSYKKIASTSFTITSGNVLDTSTIDWMIVESIP